MATGHVFSGERTCPLCRATFSRAEQKTEHDPVLVVVCPECKELLWRAGYEEDSPLVPYDPDADAGGI